MADQRLNALLWYSDLSVNMQLLIRLCAKLSHKEVLGKNMHMTALAFLRLSM